MTCAIHGQNMPDECVCRGARYWMDRCLASETKAEAANVYIRDLQRDVRVLRCELDEVAGTP